MKYFMIEEFKNLPNEIKENGYFCVWRYQNQNGRGSKIPYNPKTGENARSDDRETFCTYAEAVRAVGRFDGLGLGLFGEYGAIDIDNCMTIGDAKFKMATEIINIMDSYFELSPSKNGIRILFKTKDFKYDIEKYYINNQKLGLEVYCANTTKKFVSITGYSFDEKYEFAYRNDELLKVLDTFMKRPSKNNSVNSEIININSCLSDEKIIEKASNAVNGLRFKKLFSGNTEDYKSQSEADLALCNILAFWTGRNEDQMDRIYRKSGLFRDKWDYKRFNSTYGAITIKKSADSCENTYKKNKKMGEIYYE